MFVKKYIFGLTRNCDCYQGQVVTRNSINLRVALHNTTTFEKMSVYQSMKAYICLPAHIVQFTDNDFKQSLKEYLLSNDSYSLKEYIIIDFYVFRN